MDFNKFVKEYSKSSLNDQVKVSARSMGRGGSGGYSDRFKPPDESESEEGARVVLYPGDYKIKVTGPDGEEGNINQPYFITFEHFDGRKRKGCTCSAGLQFMEDSDGDYVLGKGDKKCVPCYHQAEGAQIRVSKRHIFNIISLEYCHKVQQKSERGTPYTAYEDCTGKKCKLCAKGNEREFGRRMYWPIGVMHTQQLLAFQNKVLSSTCKCGGDISTVAFVCPECDAVIRDFGEEPPAKGEIKALRNELIKCDDCKKKSVPTEVKECDNCKKPKPLSLWDVQMWLYTTGSEKLTNIVVNKFELIDDKLFNKIKSKMEPFDFSAFLYKTPTLEEQAKKLELPNPWRGKGRKDEDEYEEREESSSEIDY